jgi:hypothetical protein
MDFAADESKTSIYNCYVSSVRGRFEHIRKMSQFWKHLKAIDGLIASETRKRVGQRQPLFVQFVNPKLALKAFNEHHNIDSNVMVEQVGELDPLDPDNWRDEVPF